MQLSGGVGKKQDQRRYRFGEVAWMCFPTLPMVSVQIATSTYVDGNVHTDGT